MWIAVALSFRRREISAVDVDDRIPGFPGTLVSRLQLSRGAAFACPVFTESRKCRRAFRTTRGARQRRYAFAVPLNKNSSIFHAARLALQWRVK